MVICYTTKENINHYTTDFDNIDRFTEEHPYATIWYAFNEKDDVSSANVEREKCPICGSAILKGKIITTAQIIKMDVNSLCRS